MKIREYTGSPILVLIGHGVNMGPILDGLKGAQEAIAQLDAPIVHTPAFNRGWDKQDRDVAGLQKSLVTDLNTPFYETYDKSSNHKEKWERGLKNNQKKYRIKTNRKKAKRKRGKK